VSYDLREIHEITEEKEMYASREKAIYLESNLIDSREEGESIGMELLDEPKLSEVELNRMSMEELASTIAMLQARLRERNA
jgi:hypothetical protein